MGGISRKEMNMPQLDLDSVVRAAASNLEFQEINDAKVRSEMEIDDECWNRNQPLNMIAYEDQQ